MSANSAVNGSDDRTVTLLDYGAGNVRSIRNAILSLGWSIIDVVHADDIVNAKRLIFPGVGSFAAAMANLERKGFVEPLKQFIRSGRPFFGICIGMQVLFESSEEGNVSGLAVIPGRVERFKHSLPVPHIGWTRCHWLLAMINHRSRTWTLNYRAKYEINSTLCTVIECCQATRTPRSSDRSLITASDSLVQYNKATC